MRNEGGRTYVELELRDAWVWDMYRTSRFVPSVAIVTFKDVNIEELPSKELVGRRDRGGAAPAALGARARQRRGGLVRGPRLRRGRPQLALREGELDLVVRRRRRARVLRGEDPRRPTGSALPAEAVTRDQAAAAARAGGPLPRRDRPVRRRREHPLRRGVASSAVGSR